MERYGRSCLQRGSRAQILGHIISLFSGGSTLYPKVFWRMCDLKLDPEDIVNERVSKLGFCSKQYEIANFQVRIVFGEDHNLIKKPHVIKLSLIVMVLWNTEFCKILNEPYLNNSNTILAINPEVVSSGFCPSRSLRTDSQGCSSVITAIPEWPATRSRANSCSILSASLPSWVNWSSWPRVFPWVYLGKNKANHT